MRDRERELLWLRRVRDLSHLLATVRDPERLLPQILDAAIEITSAERGFLVLVRGQGPNEALEIRVEVARGFDQATLQSPEGAFSRTVVDRVLERGGLGLVTTSSEDRDVLNVTSVQDRAVKSILCVPLRLRGATQGVLYLDHRRDQLAFDEHDLPILQSFADHAALALETARTRHAPHSAPASDLFADASQELNDQIDRAARSHAPVLLLGEIGVGLETAAREIHARSSSGAPFLLMRGDADSLERLFGASGVLARAKGGAVYLEELTRLDLRAQELLLRALQDKQLRSPAEADATPISCRLYAASRSDPRALVKAGKLREDLYYHLDVLRVVVPPLRSQPQLIPALLVRLGGEEGASFQLSPHAQELLCAYAWPGNLTQLRAEAGRLAALRKRRISSQDLSPEVREGRGVPGAGPGDGQTLPEVEQRMVEAAMQTCKGNKARAARQLGIPRSTLYHLLARYGIS